MLSRTGVRQVLGLIVGLMHLLANWCVAIPNFLTFDFRVICLE